MRDTYDRGDLVRGVTAAVASREHRRLSNSSLKACARELSA